MDPSPREARRGDRSRRIGARHRIARQQLRLHVGRPFPLGSGRAAVDVPVENASVSGVGILAPRTLGLRVGRRVTVEIAGQRGRARIVRVLPSTDQEAFAVGLGFEDSDPPFLPEILRWLDTTAEESDDYRLTWSPSWA